jgi:glycosyltransferase involved in cell wall biosynthesis
VKTHKKESKMKIAIEARPIKWSYGTGIGNYTYHLIEKLNSLDSINDYTFLWTDDDPYSAIPFSKKFSYYRLPKDDLREEIEIPLWLSNEGVDIFHLPQNGFRTPIRDRRTKIIVTIHDLIPYFIPEMVRPSFLKRFITEMPQIIERADHITTVSETSKQDLIKVFNVNPEKITVIPSAPSSIYTRLPKQEVQSFLKTNFNLEKPYILYVGGLNPRKNVPELIYAYSKIHRDLPTSHLLVIPGSNSKHLQKLKQLVEALDLSAEVFFPGFVESEALPYLYNGASLFVYPSLYEGFGLPPIEAMACGTPVITSNVSSLPEVVGDAALTINPSDTLQLAETMFTVLTNSTLARNLIKRGIKHAQRYSWEQNAKRFLEVYHQVAGVEPAIKVS